jgi:hypothetical protein
MIRVCGTENQEIRMLDVYSCTLSVMPGPYVYNGVRCVLASVSAHDNDDRGVCVLYDGCL